MEGGTNYTVEDLLIRAEELLQSLGNVELAEKFYAKALAMEPENTAIMDDYAECLMEIGDVEKAAWISFLQFLQNFFFIFTRIIFLNYETLASTKYPKRSKWWISKIYERGTTKWWTRGTDLFQSGH